MGPCDVSLATSRAPSLKHRALQTLNPEQRVTCLLQPRALHEQSAILFDTLHMRTTEPYVAP